MESDTFLYFDDYEHPIVVQNITNLTKPLINMYSKNRLYKVIIGTSIETIENECFIDCVKLSTVIISHSVINIGDKCFYNCSSLEYIELEEGIMNIGKECFKNCINLKEINIPCSLNLLPLSCFSGCLNLEKINISSGLISIGDKCFKGCTKLGSIILPYTVISIGNEVFNNCINLKNITIEYQSNINKYGVGIFRNLTNPININFKNTKNKEELSENTLKFINQIPKKQYNKNNNNIFYNFEKNDTQPIITEKNLNYMTKYYYKNGTFTTISTKILYRTSLPKAQINNLVKVEMGNNVIKIDDNTFSGCSSLTSVIFSTSLTSIGNYAFNTCTNLTQLKFPNNLKELGDFCFSSCTNLLNIKGNVTNLTLKNKCFNKCVKLQDVELNSISSLGDYCFYQTNIKKIDINKTTTFIGVGCFMQCDSLKNINIPSSITHIPSMCFKTCRTLSNVIFEKDSKITTIGSFAFSDTKIYNIIIPETVINIENNCFELCKYLDLITFKNANRLINSGSNIFLNVDHNVKMFFEGIISLNYIASESLIDIMWQNLQNSSVPINFNNKTFIYDINNLNGIINNDTTKFIYKNGSVEFTFDKIINKNSFTGYSNALISIELGKYAIEISNNCFENCSELTNVVFEENCNIYKIGNYAFLNCIKLSVVIINSTLLNDIGIGCFKNCVLLKHIKSKDIIQSNIDIIYLPRTVTKINAEIFSNCTSIQEIYLHSNIFIIDNNICENCINLYKITFENCNNLYSCGSEIFKNIVNTINFRLIGLTHKTQINSSALIKLKEQNPLNPPLYSIYYNYDIARNINETQFYLSNGNFINVQLNSISSDSILNNISILTEVVTGLSVTSILSNSFENCSSLKIIDINNNIKYIGDYAFKNCINLEKISELNTLTYLGIGCFNNCSYLTQIIITSPLNILYDDCFNGCNSLESFNIPNSVVGIGNNCFSNCDNLTLLNIPNSIITIGNSCFSNCINLKTFNIPNNLDYLTLNCFSNCIKLTNIYIPKSIRNIDNNCFEKCINLTSIVFENCNLLTYVGTNIFNQISNTITMYLNNLFSNNVCIIVRIYRINTTKFW